jgi:Flp pilus assembly protein TadG
MRTGRQASCEGAAGDRPAVPDGTAPAAASSRPSRRDAVRRRPVRAHRPRDSGAAAVEFALLLPVLLLVVFGIIDFGRALNAQVTLTQAAREGARLAALSQPNVVSRTQAAATGLSPVTVAVTACAAGATQTSNATVRASYLFSFITPIGAIADMFGQSTLGSDLTLTATGVMPCGG